MTPIIVFGLVAAGQTPLRAPPSPPLVYVPSPIPVSSDVGRVRMATDVSAQIAEFDVEIRAGSESSWSGSMRTAGNITSTLSRSKSDAPLVRCDDDRRNYGEGERESLQMTLRPIQYVNKEGQFQLTVTWERPVTAQRCGERATQTIARSETFVLLPGQSRVTTAEGGLTVRLRRR